MKSKVIWSQSFCMKSIPYGLEYNVYKNSKVQLQKTLEIRCRT